MRTSQFPLSTLKESAADAEIISHQLMLRAGYIRRLAAGIYSWLPWGLRALRKVENVVREEMNRAGAMEVFLPMVQPAELWQESGRWEKYGAELLRLKDRHKRDFCLGPTHEEVIVDVARRDIQSFRHLPRHYYQIQTKFRDEVRPRFGIMRGREFLMKDAYSFHVDAVDLQREYDNMYQTYSRIFTRLGLSYRAVAADSGAIGGNVSHEFHVLADSGESIIAYGTDSNSDYAANIELAQALPPPAEIAPELPVKKEAATPHLTTCQEVSDFLKIPLMRVTKSLVLMADGQMWLLLLRGDHTLNEIKVSRLPGLENFRFATDQEIIDHFGATPGSLGPINLPSSVRLLADHAALALAHFACGANRSGFHFTGVCWGRDLPRVEGADLRLVVAGDPCPDGHGTLQLRRGIEVGHIFQLGDKYAAPMNCRFLDRQGVAHVPQMGCYGIGISRILGAAIEQGHDDRGMILPQNIAPFGVAIAALGTARNPRVLQVAMDLYHTLSAQGIDVVLDDRDERPGAMLADLELVGIPHRLTIGEKSLAQGQVEYQRRKDMVREDWPLAEVAALIAAQLSSHD